MEIETEMPWKEINALHFIDSNSNQTNKIELNNNICNVVNQVHKCNFTK